jgi:signal transduction histidine kinase
MEDVLEQGLPGKSDIKLLVVDDREDNLFSIEAILEKDGYTIRKADSGRAALRALLKEEDFTLILMDVQMPGLNGFETATMIYERDKLKHIPIIFITANDHGEDSVFKGYQMGGVDYIYKPINPELLRAKVAVFAELFKKNHALLAQEQKLAAANILLEKEIQERTLSEEKIKLLNMQLVENITQLKATNEELERFAYVASHDLQEPLRKIILFSDRLAVKYHDKLGDEGNKSIERIIKSSERMKMLIRNILSFSKTSVSSGSFEETNLNELLESLLPDLEVSIEQKKGVIEIKELPLMNVIPDQIRQLFQNMIINALKFSRPDNPPHILIYGEQVKGMQVPGIKDDRYDEDFYAIYVQDNGIGFEQKYSDEIFTLFKRLNSNDKYEGTGIGLSICKKIVEQHKGFISVTSSLNEGTTFKIILPARVSSGSEARLSLQ